VGEGAATHQAEAGREVQKGNGEGVKQRGKTSHHMSRKQKNKYVGDKKEGN